MEETPGKFRTSHQFSGKKGSRKKQLSFARTQKMVVEQNVDCFRPITSDSGRGECGRLDLWVCWTAPNIFIVAGALFYPLILKIPLVVSLSTKKFHGNCMRYISCM